MKTCPECAEEVQDAARKCRYCGHEFSARYGVERFVGALFVVLVLCLIGYLLYVLTL